MSKQIKKTDAVDAAPGRALPSQSVTKEIEQIWVVSNLPDVNTGGHVGHPTALFEFSNNHPGGQALVAGPLPVLVGKTPAVAAAIREEQIREVDEDEAEELQDEYHGQRRKARRAAALAAADENALSTLPPWAAALLAGTPGVGAAAGLAPASDTQTSMPNDLGGGELKPPGDASQEAHSPTAPADRQQQKDELTDEDEDDEEQYGPVNPNTMSKDDLLAEAAKRGVTSVNPDMTKAAIADEINANLPADDEG
jgi:hypothetical protein